MKRVGVCVLLGVAVLFILMAILVWRGPAYIMDYLNRPDTPVRQKISAALSETLGEPANLAFHISDARVTAGMHLVITVSDIRISSPALDRIGLSVRQATVDVLAGRSLARRRVVIESVHLHIPTLAYKRSPDGTWPHEVLIRQYESAERRAASDAAAPPDERPQAAPPDIGQIHIEVDDALIQPAPDLTADLKHLAIRYLFQDQKLTVEAGPVRLSGLPTFSGLATILNTIVETVETLLGNPLSTTGKLADRVMRLIGKRTSSGDAITSRGTTEFDDAVLVCRFTKDHVRLENAEFSNAEMRLRAEGTVTLAGGALDVTAGITLKEKGLEKMESGFVRGVFSEEVILPVRGTIMEPKFDKGACLKAIAKRAGKKLGFGRR